MAVEVLFDLDPAEVGLADGPTAWRTSKTAGGTEIDVAFLREDGRVLVAAAGVFRSALGAHQQVVAHATAVLGDLGSNRATAGLLEPLRVNVVDVCLYSRELQRPLKQQA